MTDKPRLAACPWRARSVLLLVCASLLWLVLAACGGSPEQTVIPTSTPDPTATLDATSIPSEYEALADWVELNASYLPRFQYDLWLEMESRPETASEAPVPPQRTDAGTDPAAAWTAYVDANRQLQRQSYRLDFSGREAPLNVVVHDVLEQNMEGASYVIEVLTWDAWPGLDIPATLYRPLGVEGERLPVVLLPPGCREDVSTHNEVSSVQRRAANLALRGFVAFATEGFCKNGILEQVPENRYPYQFYSTMAGVGLSLISLEQMIWARALDYLETRSDTDMSRVGVTGYSNGGSISGTLSGLEPRITATALVATGLGSIDDAQLYAAARDGAVFIGPDYYYYGAHYPPVFAPPDNTASVAAQNDLPPTWSLAAVNQAFFLGAPDPVYIVLGAQDPFYSITASEQILDSVRPIYEAIGAPTLPRLEIVPGTHTYDAERRRLVTDWLADVLDATPLLPPPANDYEYETPVLPPETLQIVPEGFPSLTFHELFAELALDLIAERRAADPLTGLTPDEARARLTDVLRLLPDPPPDGSPRPILLDESVFTFDGMDVKAQFWLVALNEHLRTGVLVLTRDDVEWARISSGRLYLSTDDIPLAPEDDLRASLAAEEAVVVMSVPGFGPVASSQMTIGNLARRLSTRHTLLGLGVSATQRTLDLLDALAPDTRFGVVAYGVDASNVAYFASALDGRIEQATAYQAVSSFQRFLTDPSGPVLPPTLLVPGLIAYVDVEDLQWLASPRSIVIESESDLTEFKSW